MSETGKSLRFYAGDGELISSRELSLPSYESLGRLSDPAHYVADPGLRDAVNVALLLGQPLLVTGEPGTGKTQLAGSVARELGLRSPLTFHAKTTSTARDLFYRYDALGHFQATQVRREESSAERFISYEALGLAILLSLPASQGDPYLPADFRGAGPIRSVVLVDEIDKSPRDLPNDVLDEIENLTFEVRETGKRFTADAAYRPIVILTSNSEKNLPDAFLRRCVFYNIRFPGRDQLIDIVKRRLPDSASLSPAMLTWAVDHFVAIRDQALKKKPATAELLAWLAVLRRLDLTPGGMPVGGADALALTYSVLAKNPEDREKLIALIPKTAV